MTPEESKALWGRVQANNAALRACGNHDFSTDLTPDRPIGKTWQCTRCRGEVSSLEKGWYDEGRAHERGARHART
jgi:hypothetical protein